MPNSVSQVLLRLLSKYFKPFPLIFCCKYYEILKIFLLSRKNSALIEALTDTMHGLVWFFNSYSHYCSNPQSTYSSMVIELLRV